MLPTVRPPLATEQVEIANDISPHKVPSPTILSSQLREFGATRQELLEPMRDIIPYGLMLHAPRSPLRGVFRGLRAGVMFRRHPKQARDLPGVE